jgi:hypothetical protein
MMRSPGGRPFKADHSRRLWKAVVLLALFTSALASVAYAREGRLELSAIDRDSGKPIAVRVHLVNVATKRPVRPAGAPSLGDHFVFFDRIALELPLGSYRFVMERGPEYLERTGHFTINNYADDRKTVDMKRFVNMADEGWYGGDLDMLRSDREIEQLMLAEDLYIAALVTSTNPKNESGVTATRKSAEVKAAGDPVRFEGKRFYTRLAAEDSRGGNFLLMFNQPEPPKLPPVSATSYPSSLTIAAAARQAGGFVDAARPFSWDLPIWVAAGKLDSVEIAHRHLLRDGVIGHEAGGRPHDPETYPRSLGVAHWTLDIYYHLLNCGLRLPPTAGSGSGHVVASLKDARATTATKSANSSTKTSPAASSATNNFNPVGYNRIYVFVEGELTWEKWWQGLRAGRSIITNGPLIRPTVEGRPPGHVFKADRGQTVELEIGLSLSTREKIGYLEIVKDGAVAHNVRLDKWKESGGKLPQLTFTESGWFLVRAVADEPRTYRFATTAPYYVEIGYTPRISKASAQFFVDWCREAQKRLTSAKFSSEREHDEVAGYWRRAEEYWTSLLKRANAP